MKTKGTYVVWAILILMVLVPWTVSGDEYNANDVGDLNAFMDSASNIPDLADTINIAAGMYSITSPIVYFDTSEASLDLVGVGPGLTVLDGNGVS